MSIRPLFNPDDILKDLEQNVEKLNDKILKALCFVGEKCVVEARNNSTYQDQTGNLRSSIGYVVVKDGNTVQMSNFNSNSGGSKGADVLKKLAQKRGVFLIVAAGMEYAGYVEAKGLDVITNSELVAERLVPKMMKNLGFKVK